MTGKRVKKAPTFTKVGRFGALLNTPPPPPERAPAEPLSLPLAVAAPDTPASPNDATTPEGKWTWRRKLELPADSVVRKKAAQIIAMKIMGHTNDDICAEVKLSERSLKQYLWLAGKNGWCTFVEPKDELEYGIAHKAVRNLDRMLDSENIVKVAMPATFKVADLVLAPQFENATAPAQNLNVLSIQITHAEGPAQPVREGTVSGIPAYIEAELGEL